MSGLSDCLQNKCEHKRKCYMHFPRTNVALNDSSIAQTEFNVHMKAKIPPIQGNLFLYQLSEIATE